MYFLNDLSRVSKNHEMFENAAKRLVVISELLANDWILTKRVPYEGK